MMSAPATGTGLQRHAQRSGWPWWLRGTRAWHWAAWAVPALLCACAGTQPPPAPDAAAAARADDRAGAVLQAQAVAARLNALEAEQRALAQGAARASHWQQAAWHWDSVLALRPGDAGVLQQRDAALAQAAAAADTALQAARKAQQRGDAERAQRLYLEVLAHAPEHNDAAQALRAMERERVARQHLGQLSAQTLTRRDTAAALMQPAPAGRTGSTTAGDTQSNDIEHASLLADQGELSAAIQLLGPLAAATPANPQARQLMADLQLRKAQALVPTDRIGARQAAAESVRLNPGRQDARQLLRRLSEPEPPAVRPNSSPQPARPP